MGSIHNTRIIRFLAVLGAVVITIFIYASYSTNTSLTPPLHMRGSGFPASAAYHQQLTANSSEHKTIGIEERSAGKQHGDAAGSGGFSGNAIHKSTHSDKIYSRKAVAVLAGARKPHREPTIDADAGDGSSGGVGAAVGSDTDDEMNMERYNNEEEQYVQNVENVMGNVNSSSGGVAFGSQQLLSQQQTQMQSLNQQDAMLRVQAQQGVQQQQNNVRLIDSNLNKISDSDVLIPTSNLQKFIENADKILKNITVAPAATNNDIITNKEAEQQSQAVQADQQQQQKSSENRLPGSQNNGHKYMDKQSNSGTNTNTNSNNEINKSPPVNENEIKISDDGEPLPPSVVMTIKRANSAPVDAVAQATKNKLSNSPSSALSNKDQAKSKVPAKVNSTTPKAHGVDQGIPTRELYESGHLNEEIDIERLCPYEGANLRVLILITSALDHGPARLAIRQTWGHYGVRRDVSMAFVVGRTTNETVNQLLSKENYIYGDLIRGNFIDSYNNLTLKTISSLEWVDGHCSHAKYILKTDDDMFINVPKLLSFLDAHANEKRVIFGRLAKKWKPIRNKKSKYFVSTGQFSAAVFPPFTTGPAYVLSSDIVHDLYVRSLNQVYLKLEDVFTTGIVAQQLNIKRAHAYEFLNRRISFNPCNLRKAISVHMIKSNEQFDLWKKLLDQTTRCK